MSDKTFAQKGIEKTLMLERHQSLSLIVAKTADGPKLVVGISGEEGGFTPLATLLSQREIDTMTPQFQTQEWLNTRLDRARSDIPHTNPDDFTGVRPLSYLTDIPRHITN